MLKTVFAIGNETTGCDILLLEIGEGYCCHALLNGIERTFQQIKYITYDEFEEENTLEQFFDELKNENCSQVIVCSAFPQSLLIPAQFNKDNYSLLRSIHNNFPQKKFTDTIPEWQMIIDYSIPVSVFNLITEKFSLVQFLHAFTPVLKIYNGFTAPDQIDLHFSTLHFRVLIKKQNHVQLAQTYLYKTPLDVAYYLLKICYEFELDQSQVFLIVSGLIDKDSAMYTELNSYFLNLHFAQAPTYSLPQHEYPHHYFTSLYNLAACVS